MMQRYVKRQKEDPQFRDVQYQISVEMYRKKMLSEMDKYSLHLTKQFQHHHEGEPRLRLNVQHINKSL